MTNLHIVEGDATSPQVTGPKIIAHLCNDIGAWGRGFVMAISRRWPQPESEYRNWYRHRADNSFGLGAVQLVPVEPDIWVANMIGQHGIRGGRGAPPIRYQAVETCLSALCEHAGRLDASVHMPRIGCGLAGGRWEHIEPLIVSQLCDHGISVTVYDI